MAAVCDITSVISKLFSLITVVVLTGDAVSILLVSNVDRIFSSLGKQRLSFGHKKPSLPESSLLLIYSQLRALPCLIASFVEILPPGKTKLQQLFEVFDARNVRHKA